MPQVPQTITNSWSLRWKAAKHAFWKILVSSVITFSPYLALLLWAPKFLGKDVTLSGALNHIYEQGTYLFLSISFIGSAFVSFLFRHPCIKVPSTVPTVAWLLMGVIGTALMLGAPFIDLGNGGSTIDLKVLKIVIFLIFIASFLYAFYINFALKFYHPEIVESEPEQRPEQRSEQKPGQKPGQRPLKKQKR